MNEESQNNASLPQHGAYISKKERREQRREERQRENTHVQKSGSRRRLLLWGTAAVLLIGGGIGVYYAATSSAPPANGDLSGSLTDTISAQDWTWGNSEAAVTIVEYGDFQCPACGQYYPIVKQLKNDFAGTVQFVYRNFPLYRAHPNAELAAKAAEAAGRQGKFWEMHDLLFERQQAWSLKPRPRNTFIGYAEELGLDKNRFETDIDSSLVKDNIDADVQSGFAAGVNATPTFFLNGKQITNPASYAAFRELLVQAVTDAGAAEEPTTGTSSSAGQTNAEKTDL